MSKDIITVLLAGAWIILGALMAMGKVKLTIQYKEETSEWPGEDDERVANYVRPMQQVQPPTLVEEPSKRKRGRPRKALRMPLQ